MFSNEQLEDKELYPIIMYLKDGTLPTDQKLTSQIVNKATMYTLVDGILYYVGHGKDVPLRAVVPTGLK